MSLIAAHLKAGKIYAHEKALPFNGWFEWTSRINKTQFRRFMFRLDGVEYRTYSSEFVKVVSQKKMWDRLTTV